MKHPVLFYTGASVAGIMGFFSFGRSFFEMMVHRKRTGKEKKSEPKFRHMRINHPKNGFEKEYEAGKAWCAAQPMESFYIRSVDGLLLHASFFKATDAERIVILCHGYKGSGFGDFANIARFLHEQNCDLLFIDERCCGKSEGEYITFGAREKYDIRSWAYFMEHHNPENLPIYLYGQSMGAASLLMASEYRLPENVRGLIADCGFRSMKAQMQDMAASWFHIHWIGLMLFRMEFFCNLLAGFSMKEASTAKAMRTNKIPVLFFHGKKDTYVSPVNSIYHYTSCRAKKELILVAKARHLCSNYVSPELYRKKLLQFFHDTAATGQGN